MDDKEIIAKIARALVALEEQGELILTTNSPEGPAGAIFHSALEAWFGECLKTEEPIECTIPHLLEKTFLAVRERFGVQDRRAREIANAYYKEWLKTRTTAEVAQIYWHETPWEIAARAYYHIELGMPDNRDLAYSEWRLRH